MIPLTLLIKSNGKQRWCGYSLSFGGLGAVGTIELFPRVGSFCFSTCSYEARDKKPGKAQGPSPKGSCLSSSAVHSPHIYFPILPDIYFFKLTLFLALKYVCQTIGFAPVFVIKLLPSHMVYWLGVFFCWKVLPKLDKITTFFYTLNTKKY